MDINVLIKEACQARESSYAPYSNISVGAALLVGSGKIYTGANIESASFSPTVCAERVAFFSAVHAGEREFLAIAIAGGENGKEAKATFPPCGVCRQVMAEFCDGDFQIILTDGKNTSVYTLDEMLPARFDKKFI